MEAFDVAQSADARSGKSLGKNQLWWTFTKSTAIGSQITSASSYGVRVGVAGRQLRAPTQPQASGDPITNARRSDATNGLSWITPASPTP
jgi:feruloyl esterase